MNTGTWISTTVSKLLPAGSPKSKEKVPSAPAGSAQAAIKSEANAASGVRSTRERLEGSLRHKEEALSPRVLRRTLEELKAIVAPRYSETEAGRRAQGGEAGVRGIHRLQTGQPLDRSHREDLHHVQHAAEDVGRQ